MINPLADKMNRLELLKDEDDITSILNKACNILGYPILMIDTSYNLFAYTQGITTDDIFWNELTTLKYLTHESVDFLNSENFIQAFAKSDIVSLMKSDKLKYDRMNGKLFDKDNVQIGNITAMACLRPFEAGDAELFEYLCEILSVKLQNSEFYNKIERVYSESTINRLLEGTEVSETQDIADLLSELKPNIFLAVVDTMQYEPTNTHFAYFRDLFRKIQPEFKYYIHVNNIIILLSTANDVLRINQDLSGLYKFFMRYGIYAGISGRFSNFSGLKNHYREAINALNYGLKSKKLQHIFTYDEFRLEHFLHSVNDTSDISRIYSPVVALIQKHDQETGESLSNMLYAYLSHGMDEVSTCIACGILPELLKESLNQLEQLFAIDWTNGDMLFNIFITLKLMDT